MSFQSTLPRGSDTIWQKANNRQIKFQSTLPRGSDTTTHLFSVAWMPFQSTLPRGSDLLRHESLPGTDISIHAPSRERQHYKRIATAARYFNPRSLAGATLLLLPVLLRHYISIHAPSRERLRADARHFLVIVFQSTLPRGSDS